MKRGIVAVLILVGLAGFGIVLMAVMVAYRSIPHVTPLPDLPQHREREATVQELEAVNGLTGKPKNQVAVALGKPHVEYIAFGKGDTDEDAKREGRAVWEYDHWKGRLFIHFHNGLMVGSYYLNENEVAQVPCD
jgi:hypothetical protein